MAEVRWNGHNTWRKRVVYSGPKVVSKIRRISILRSKRGHSCVSIGFALFEPCDLKIADSRGELEKNPVSTRTLFGAKLGKRQKEDKQMRRKNGQNLREMLHFP